MNPQSHPIPQNVTSFQFHLVGDMTLKQFGYLAAGSGIAYALFVFLTPIYPIVAWPLVVISALLGVAFAFLPIGARPLDYWVVAFLKAVYSPTKRAWKKNGKNFKNDPLFNSRLVTYLSSISTPPVASEAPKPPAPVSPIRNVSPAPISTPTATIKLPTPDELRQTVDLARQAQNLQLRIIQTERLLNQIKSEASQPTAIPVDYSDQVNQVILDLQKLVTAASQKKQELEVATKENQPQTQPAISATRMSEKVKVVTPTKASVTQVALTSFPNVLNGVVKDKTGNYLEGCIAVIYDREGLPVRALKTNKLGQFTGSTPLPNGTYKLAIEKEGFTFNVLQIELGGEVLPPLLITAE